MTTGLWIIVMFLVFLGIGCIVMQFTIINKPVKE